MWECHNNSDDQLFITAVNVQKHSFTFEQGRKSFFIALEFWTVGVILISQGMLVRLTGTTGQKDTYE